MNKKLVFIFLVLIVLSGIYFMKNNKMVGISGKKIEPPSNYLNSKNSIKGILELARQGDCILHRNYDFNNKNVDELERKLIVLYKAIEKDGKAKEIHLLKNSNIGKLSLGEFFFITTYDTCPRLPFPDSIQSALKDLTKFKVKTQRVKRIVP